MSESMSNRAKEELSEAAFSCASLSVPIGEAIRVLREAYELEANFENDPDVDPEDV